MYLYESHLGGLYTNDTPLKFEDLYCDGCGDSDTEVGYFEDNDAYGVWEAIRPSDLACIGCKKADQCDIECEEACGRMEHKRLSYDLLYCMQFLAGSMSFERMSYVYLVCRDKETGKIFADLKPANTKCSFGERHSIPSSFCLKKDLEEKIALSLVPDCVELVEKPKKTAGICDGDREFVIYECVVKKRPEEGDDPILEYRDGWYRWLPASDFKLVHGEEWLIPFIKG